MKKKLEVECKARFKRFALRAGIQDKIIFYVRDYILYEENILQFLFV